jgi:hypothetical protein
MGGVVVPPSSSLARRNVSTVTPLDCRYLFSFLLLANFLQYLEAGAVPALLLQLSESFQMSPAQEVSSQIPFVAQP